MVTGLITPEEDGLFSDWHEDNVINPMRGFLFGLSWSPGLKGHPVGWLISTIAGATGFVLGTIMFAEKHLFEPLSRSEPREQQFANPTPGRPYAPQFSKEQIERITKKFRKTKDKEVAILDLLEIANNEMSIHTGSTFTPDNGDFTIHKYGECPPGYTFSPTLGVCLLNG